MVSIKKRLASVLTLFAFFLSLAVGFSSFEYQDSTEVRTTVSTSNKVPCCYISGKAKKYTHIEGALKDAVSGETVIVIPGTNPTIETSCTVPKGVTLSIRYEENTEPIMDPSANDSTGSFSTDCKNTITVSEDVVITNYGNILVGGHLSGGSGGSNACGHTGYEYVDVILKKSAQIVNESGGSLTCYGYIKEDSTEPTYDDNGNSTRLSNDVRGVYAESGSTVFLPFIVRDFRGGSISFAMALDLSISKYHVSPFNQFDIRNISAPIYADSGATVKCIANIIAGGKNNNTSFNLVGTGALFTLDSNSSFMMDVLPNTDGIAVYKSYGSLSMNSISISIGGQSVSSDSFDLPISFRQRIYLNANKDGSSCTVNLPYFYKILPGGAFCINTNVTANLPDGSGWIKKDYARLWGYYDGLPLPTGYPTGYGNIGKIIVNGKVTSNKMAGYITTTKTSGTASFKASNISLTCYDYSTENTKNYRKEYSPKLYYYNSSGGYFAASEGTTYTSASGAAYFKQY